MKITSRIVENYLNCKYKAQLALRGEAGTPHDYEVLVGELQAEYRLKATEALLRRQKLESAPTFSTVTIDELKQGYPLILDCTLEHDQFQFHFDALKRVDGESSLGDFHYTPIVFHHENNVRAEHKTHLAFEAFVLGQVQESVPEFGDLIYGRACDSARVRLPNGEQQVRKIADWLKSAQSGATEAAIRLNRHCDACEFRERCKAEAVQKDDLSPLRGIPDAEIEKQRTKGIFTINQLSYTFRPCRGPKALKNRRPPYSPSLHAQAAPPPP